MKKIIYIAIGLIAIVLTLIVLRNNKREVEKRVYHYDREAPILIKSDTIQLAYIDQETSFTATFQPYRETRIMADVQGKIVSFYVDEGDVVKKGSPLVKIDDALLKPELESVKIQIDGLEKDVKRYTVLTERDAIQGVQLEKAELGLRSARAQHNKISEQIRKTTIYAPFDGVITQKFSEAGSYAAPGMPLLHLSDIRTLKFAIQVPESELKFFHPDQYNQIQVDALPNINFNGKLSMIGSKSNPAHNFPVQFTVSNSPELAIKSGMYGNVLIKNNAKAQGFMIPSEALLGSNLKPQVYVVQNGKAVLKDIRLAGQFKNRAIVNSGVNAGDIIVIGGFINLFDGAPVSIN
jgi:RND family efflux transporter MFP subunit